MGLKTVRREIATRPIFSLVQSAMPTLSTTESDAIDAGDTWWDASLFTGKSAGKSYAEAAE